MNPDQALNIVVLILNRAPMNVAEQVGVREAVKVIEEAIKPVPSNNQ